MPAEPNLAIALLDQPLILAAVGVLVVVAVVVVVLRKRRREQETSPWRSAGEELGIDYVPNGSEFGGVLRGRVNKHSVSVTPSGTRGRNKKKSTLYTVKYQAPEAPKFIIMKRVDDRTPVVDTGNPEFDKAVAMRTEEFERFVEFLTPARQAAILRVLANWPSAQITNRDTKVKIPRLEASPETMVDTICHLVATAESFDRPSAAEEVAPATAAPAATPQFTAAPPARTEPSAAVGVAGAAGAATAANVAEDDHDVLTEVRLDEISVLRNLFDSGLTRDAIEARFAEVYQGRAIQWTGEVLRVGSIDGNRQRIAAFIGSADGKNAGSGRVVAVAAVSAARTLTEGDVVSFSGTLGTLDPVLRMFHIN